MKTLATFALLLSTLAPAAAATVSLVPGKPSLLLSGEMALGDDERFRNAINAANRRGIRIERLFLNSNGGNFGGAHRLAGLVAQAGVDTVVGPTHTCASACVIVLAAGRKRVAFSTSRVGVHSAAERGRNAAGQEVNVETDAALAATLKMARLYAALGVPPRIIGRMVSTPNAAISWLTQSDAISWNMTILPVQGTLPDPDAIGDVR